MGDRYELELRCVYCNENNKNVWYAPTCSSDTFVCEKCKNINFITNDCKAKKIEDVTMEDIKLGFLENTNTSWTEEKVKEMCEEHLKDIKGDKK